VRGKRAIDLGCGTGRVTHKLLRLGAWVTAVDFSEKMMGLARAKFRPGQVEFMAADLTKKLPFPNNAFHLATACLVLEHIRDKKAFFSEVHRVLKPGGILYLTEMHPAMVLLGKTANFTDPRTGRDIRPRSHVRPISELVMSALGVGFGIKLIKEYAGRKSMAVKIPKMTRYVGWPLLAVMVLEKKRPGR
jgi:ubiquinone/menaquinone biosynthesis C-methylase UbiE